ncbi:MAG: flavodoxin [Eubacteriales bacterium]|nr:flavodoxin [Eubacteriales bacterium]MDD3882340.1 flavodoxin [Eubacteriales bacterium]MDD4512439.1 flavodoxin [Eubacteriales bacterium]
MKEFIAIIIFAVMLLSLTVCASAVTGETAPASNVLVAFFSRTGENYGVGVIKKGNTHIIADIIAGKMGAYTFEIARVTPYPEAYRECTDEAKNEKNANARPELTAAVDNFSAYDVVFLGYPNWWGDMPMPVYTFLESYDFSGKTVIPFCTHAGSGLSGTESTIAGMLSGATVLDGLAVAGTTAQNDYDAAEKAVTEWLEKLALEK